jgi:hypothetical protein
MVLWAYSNKPSSTHEALAHPNWHQTVCQEIESINDDIWVFIKLPPNVVPIKTKWVFYAKTRVNDVVKKLKAILVAKGC